MGVTTNGAHIIVALGALLALSTVAGVGGNVAEQVSEAKASVLQDQRELFKTDFRIEQATYIIEQETLLIEVINTGSRTLRVSDTDFVVDGEYFPVLTTVAINYPVDGSYSSSYNVSDVPSTDVWFTEESFYVRLDVTDPDRVQVVTEHGVAETRTIGEKDERQSVNSWPTYGQNPANTRHSDAIEGPTGDVLSEWSYGTGDKIETSTIAYTELLSVLADELIRTIYFGNKQGKVFSLKAEDGTLRWKRSLGQDAVQSTPTVYKDTVYVTNKTGTVVALSWLNGETRWTFEANREFNSGTTVANDTVFVATSKADGTVYALNAINGSKQWTFTSTNGQFKATPAHANGSVYVTASQNRTLFALYEDNGSVRWQRPLSDGVVGGAAVKDGTLYVGDKGGTLRAFDAETGTPVWNATLSTTPREITTTPAVTATNVYVVNRKANAVHSVYVANGSEKWDTTFSNEIRSPPSVASGTVYVGDNAGTVHALYAGNGSERWSLSVGGGVDEAAPVVLNDTVYVGSDDTVYAIREPAPEVFDEAWPQFGYDRANRGSASLTGAVGAAEDVVVAWTASDVFAANSIEAAPTAANGTVFVGTASSGSGGDVRAFDEQTGAQEWVYDPTSDNAIRGAPAYADGMVYVGNEDPNVIALHANNGSEEWKWPGSLDLLDTPDSFKQPPTVADGTVYAGDAGGVLYAIDAENGSRDWEYETGGSAISGAPAYADGTVYVTDGSTLHAVHADNGTQKWGSNYTAVSSTESSPIVVNGTVYVTDGSDGDVHAVYAANGTRRWKSTTNTDQEIDGAPAYADGTIYFGDNNGDLFAFHANNGTSKWDSNYTDSGNHEMDAQPAVVDGVVYVPDRDGEIHLVNATNGDGIAVFDGATGSGIQWPVAVANGQVYFTNSSAEVTALEPQDPLELEWRSSVDWDAASDRYGVVHESNDSTDWAGAGELDLGYPPADQGGSALAGFWPLDEDDGGTAYDLSGNERAGTIEGATPEREGLWNRTAYNFSANASDEDAVDLGTGNLGISETNMTVSVWFRAENFARDPRFVAKASGTTDAEQVWALGVTEVSGEHRLQFELRTDPGTPATTTVTADSGALATGEWVHATAVYDGSEIRLYMNGTQVGSATASGDIVQDATVPAKMGLSPNTSKSGGDHPFNGTLDEVRLYNRTLPADEVEHLHEVGRNGSARNGYLVTGWKQHSFDAEVADLELRNVLARVPADTSITVVVESDTNGDGTVDERSDPVTLDGSGGPYDVTGLSTNSDRFRLEIELRTDDLTVRPTLDRIELAET